MSKIYNKKLKIIQTDSKIKYDVVTLQYCPYNY